MKLLLLMHTIKAQTNYLHYFEYAPSDLRIRTANIKQNSVVTSLKSSDIKFYIHEPDSGQHVKCILRDLPLSTECEEIMV